MIYALAAAFVAGLALGAWLMWLVMRSSAAAPTGGPQDPAVVDAVKTAGAPAEMAAHQAAEEIQHADDDALDARARELLERARLGK